MKKIISIALVFTLVFTFMPSSFATDMPGDEDIKMILDVMGIMTYDAKGNFNENQYVTRAALAKILVTSSQHKGAATGTSRISPFSDVMYTHWGAPYISIASKNKFMTGYSDGSFRPDSYIKYEEALSAILRLIGYTNADYTGAYPAGQIAKAADIGLSDNILATQGNPLTRSEMAKLVYNMLNTPAKGDTAIYATVLGYKPSSELLTIGDVLDDNITGPVTVKAGTLSSLGFSSAKVYRNGSSAKISDISNYDVIYYSKKSNMIWAYSQKISGIVNAISPNKEAPTSVTVSGVTYELPYYAAQRAFGLDGLEVGETVTMLLDKNSAVCDAYNAETLYQSIIGVVTNVSAKTMTASDGSKTSNYYVSVLTPDGSSVDILNDSASESLIGQAVEVDYSTGKIRTISKGSGNSSGYISASSYTWGKTALANNINIVEIDDNGNMIKLSLNRLDGVNLNSSNVLLSSKNASGVIDSLILKNVTGDMHKYGIITSIDRKVSTDGTVSSYTYNYDLGGVKGSMSLKTTNLSSGPCIFMYKDGELETAKNLTRADNVSQLTPSYASLKNNVKHRISPDVLVYKIVDDSRISTTLDEAVSYTGTIWVYYDNIQSAGGMVRVIYLK